MTYSLDLSKDEKQVRDQDGLHCAGNLDFGCDDAIESLLLIDPPGEVFSAWNLFVPLLV